MCASGRMIHTSPGRAPSAAVEGAVRIDRRARASTRVGPAARAAAPAPPAVDAVRGEQQEPVPGQLAGAARADSPSRRRRSPSEMGTAVHGDVGDQHAGAGGGTAPRGGRPANGRVGSGVVSGESTYQNGSASRPESTVRAGRRVGGRAAEHVGPVRRARSASGGTRKSMVAVVTARFSRAAACRSSW